MSRLTSFFKDTFRPTKGGASQKNSDKKIDFNLAVENVKDFGIVMYDTNGIIISWDKGAEEMSGYTSEFAIGKSFEIFYSKEAIENGEPWYNLNMTKKLGRFERNAWRLRKDGSGGWANIIFTTFKNETGGLCGYLVIIRDVTEAKKTKSN